jgi:hypothetical protein
MAAQALPLLAAAGAALLLSGGKKKRNKSPRSGEKCNPDLDPPKGFMCESGFLQEETVEESELDDLSKEDAGDFDVEEDNVGLTEGEEGGDEAEVPEPEPEPDPEKTCEEFMTAVHVVPQNDDELPINTVAVEESVLPTMRSAANSLLEALGAPLDEESVGPVLVLEGLRALIPVCKWKYDAAEDEFTYDDGKGIESNEAQDVLFGLIKLSLGVIEEINAPDTQNEPPQPQQG